MFRKSLIFALFAGLALLSCSKNASREIVNPDEPTLGLAIEFPTLVQSKSEAGTLPATDAENAIHSLSIWVFESESHNLVTSKAIPESDFPPAGGVRRYSLPVTTEFASAHPNVDVFALVNAASIGCTNLNADSEAGAVSSWVDLNDSFFGKGTSADYFGLSGSDNPVRSVDESVGLPMSGISKNLSVQGQAPVLKLETLKIRRAVSRMRFVFCKTQTEGSTDVVSINRVSLAGNQIPLQEYVFTDTQTGIVANGDNTYEIEPFYVLDGSNPLINIAENAVPENYIYVNQDPLVYEKLINDAVAAHELTDLGYFYFRESDKRLIGWITYTVNGSERTREFSMGSAGDFGRNHTWTLLGFFLGGRNLQLAVSVLPWDYNKNTVNFSDQAVTVTSKFTVDEEENKDAAVITETSKDHYDVNIVSGKTVKGHVYITTPVGGNLMIRPEGDASAFVVTPDLKNIDPTTNGGRIDIHVRKNPAVTSDYTGKSITLSFSVENGERTIDANTEAVDKVYRFVL